MSRARQFFIFIFIVVLLAFLLARLFYLQVLQSRRFSEMASGQHNAVMKIEPRRGTIFDRYMEPLAINLDVPSVYADPRSIKDKDHAADILSKVLDLEHEKVKGKIERDKAFVWIKRKIDHSKAKELESYGLEGVYIISESKRSYSNDNMAAHVIGFAGMDNEGLEGLELRLNDRLKGKPGWRHLVRDAKRRVVLFNEETSVPPRNGNNVILTIDSVIQYIAEEELRKMALKHNASAATVIVMDPYTGEILAMANYPDYDLNLFSQVPRDNMKNDAISSVYEPGSVFKIVTASAALNEGVAGLEDRYDCENGEYRVGGRVLHDYHPYGELTFRDIISKSSNIGTVKVAQKLGEEKLYEYIKCFGLGERSGIDLSGEVPGISRPPEIWSKSDITTIPIGQGIAVTPIQLACAISVIANGGELVTPYVVDRITTWEGKTYSRAQHSPRRRVIEADTCEDMKDALGKVITEGTGRSARSRDYNMCGKTGTAQMVSPSGGYYPDKYYATFIGFAPMEHPVVSIVVIAKDPHPAHFGGTVAGPVFKKIAERTLQYMGSNTAAAYKREY